MSWLFVAAGRRGGMATLRTGRSCRARRRLRPAVWHRIMSVMGMKLAALAEEHRGALWKALGFAPTPKQLEILDDRHMTVQVAGGWRGGKSRVGSMKAGLLTLCFLAEYKERAAGQVAWLVGSDYERCRAEFDHPEGSLATDLQKVWPGRVEATKRIDPGQISVYGVGAKPFIIKTKSASDPSSLGMESPVWILGCEAAQFDLDTHYRLGSRVAEARARFPGYGMLMYEGTFESVGRQGGITSWYASYWQRWKIPDIREQEDAASFSLASESNIRVFPPCMAESCASCFRLGSTGPPPRLNHELAKRKLELPEDMWLEKHMGVPVPPSNRVFPMFDPAVHVKECQYDPDEPLYLAIDPGYSGKSSTYTVLFVQKKTVKTLAWDSDQWQAIDEIAINKTLSTWSRFTVSDICSLTKNKPYWANKHKYGVIDIAGARHADAQESNEEVWMRETGLVLRHQTVKVLPGIDRMKAMLKVNPMTGEPGFVFDPKCKLLGSEFGAWPNPFDGLPHVYRFPEDAQGQVIAVKPRDEYCDGIKAATYLFVDQLGYADATAGPRIIQVRRRMDLIAAGR